MERRQTNLIFCEVCKVETEHTHLIDAPYGLPGAYMSGTERYECSRCGNDIRYGDRSDLPFLYEPEAKRMHEQGQMEFSQK